MEKIKLDPNQPVSVLTVADLEALLTKIIQKVIRQEIINLKRQQGEPEEISEKHPLETFIETFGTWEDDRTDEEIVKQIYDSRGSSYAEKIL